MSTLDTQVAQSETPEQIADRIARDWFPEHDRGTNRMALSNDILSALRNERNRCVKVAEDAYQRLDVLNAEGAEPMRAVLKAIREGR